MAIGFLPSPAFAGWPFRVAYRFPLPGTRRDATVRSSDVTRGSGKQADLLQMLTPSSPSGRPAPARRPDGRVAAASPSALARGPGLPGSSDTLTALPYAADNLLQRAPRRRDGDSAPAAPTGRILTARARSHVFPSPEERGFPRSPGSRGVGGSTHPGVFRGRARRAPRGDARAIRPHAAGSPVRSGPPVRAERRSSGASFPPSGSRECVGNAPAIDRPLDAAPESGNNPVGVGTGGEQPVARTPGLGGIRDARIPPV